eukprot:TRINITY_DN333_c0_g1_i4.p1 TRINITY_DN333_c0_g1~~TRINITY_DN333_c0_g1_i4.p1  ORF type:complete len:164 (+),score=28.08 TRINITY_DN333_c0_g1_i4:520-1011(+)
MGRQSKKRYVLKALCREERFSAAGPLTTRYVSSLLAAQLAADARLRASRTSQAVAHRIEDVRHRAEDVRHRAHLVRERAAEVRDRAKDQTRIMREKAAQLRKRAGHAKDRAVAARDKLLDMKDSVQQRVSSKITSRKYFSDARSILLPEEKPLPMVHTRISDT